MREILDKLDKIQDDITEIKVVQIKNTADIEHHIQRTALAEENIEILRDELSKEKVAIRLELKEELKPMKKYMDFAKGAIWALGVAGAILMGLNELGILQKLFS